MNSSLFKRAKANQSKIDNYVNAIAETDELEDVKLDDDAADDPAIWYNKNNPSKSVIYGSNKKAGILAYDLNGNEIQFVEYAKVNNIDVRNDIKFGDISMDILACSNTTNRTIDLFLIDKNGKLDYTPTYSIILPNFKPHGFCLHKNRKNELYAFVNNKGGEIQQHKIYLNNSGQFNSKKVRNFKVKSKVEGMVADDLNEKLYVSEEEVGIHEFNSNENANTNGQLLNGNITDEVNGVYDIEGLALLPPHYLIASNQGNFTYSIFDLQKNEYVTSFKIMDDKIDGVEETDGIEILPYNLNDNFPNGIFVAHDGYNYDGKQRKNQNFKYVDLLDVIGFLKKVN